MILLTKAILIGRNLSRQSLNGKNNEELSFPLSLSHSLIFSVILNCKAVTACRIIFLKIVLVDEQQLLYQRIEAILLKTHFTLFVHVKSNQYVEKLFGRSADECFAPVVN